MVEGTKREGVLPLLIAEQATKTPDRIFIQEAGGIEQSYFDFHQDCLGWAAALAHLGISSGNTVATILPNSVTAYHCWMGLAWLRAIEVAINHEYQGRMLVHILNDSTATVLIASDRFLQQISAVADQLTCLETVVVPDSNDVTDSLPFRVVAAAEFAERRSPIEAERPDHWDTASIIYTSGTTGASKGVICTWAQLAECVGACFPDDEAELQDGAYYSPWQPFHLTGRTALEIAVRFPMRLVIRERFSISAFWSDVRAYQCTHFFCAFIGAWMWREARRDDDADNPLRRLLMAPLIPEYRQFEQRFGVKVSTAYASVEAGFPLHPAHDPVNHRTCGRMRSGYELRIVDDHDVEVRGGEMGELMVRSEQPWRSFNGYFNNPEATAGALRNGWFHTGDAFVEDAAGDLYFVDRLKDYIKYRGHNVSAAEVEAAVLEYPAVAECACVGVPSDLAAEDVVGGDDIRIFVVTDGTEIVAHELMDFLIKCMPRFMVPRYIDVVSALPKNHLNKVTKPELRVLPIGESTWDREAAGVVVPR